MPDDSQPASSPGVPWLPPGPSASRSDGGGMKALDATRVKKGGHRIAPVLLLLHGLGATGDVWRGLLDLLNDRWPGRWVAPDLPGHGGSEALASYSFGRLAAAVAPAVPPADRVVALGHSLAASWRSPSRADGSVCASPRCAG